MTTIHSYIGDQPTLDRRHDDLYRARVTAMAMIPTSTGAAVALEEVLQKLAGKLDGTAMRVPTSNVSTPTSRPQRLGGGSDIHFP